MAIASPLFFPQLDNLKIFMVWRYLRESKGI